MSDFAIVDGSRFEVRDGVLRPEAQCAVCESRAPLANHLVWTPAGSAPVCGVCFVRAREMRWNEPHQKWEFPS